MAREIFYFYKEGRLLKEMGDSWVEQRYPDAGELEAPFWVLDDVWSVDTVGYDVLLDFPENDELFKDIIA